MILVRCFSAPMVMKIALMEMMIALLMTSLVFNRTVGLNLNRVMMHKKLVMMVGEHMATYPQLHQQQQTRCA